MGPGHALAVLGLTLLLGTGLAEAGSLLAVGVDRVPLAPGERIVGFEVTVTSGRIVALPALPPGWSVSVDNYPTWRTHVDGVILIGVAALDPPAFRRFLVVESYDAGGAPFDVELVLVVTADFSRERRLRVPMGQLRIVPAGGG